VQPGGVTANLVSGGNVTCYRYPVISWPATDPDVTARVTMLSAMARDVLAALPAGSDNPYHTTPQGCDLRYLLKLHAGKWAGQGAIGQI
jgi:hypothetical protein